MSSKVSDISVVFLDVDGVLTNGQIYVSEDSIFRSYSVLDGMGIKLLLASGIQIVVVSGGGGGSITRRLRSLGITHIYTEISHKLPVVQQVLARLSVNPSRACFLGDDINDVECMTFCGYSFAPTNAHPSALLAATHCPPIAGGQGFVRHIADLILSNRKDTLMLSHSLTNE